MKFLEKVEAWVDNLPSWVTFVVAAVAFFLAVVK